MLTYADAFRVVRHAIGRSVSLHPTLSPSEIASRTLRAAGITDLEKAAIVEVIVMDPDGVRQFEQNIAPNFADDIDLDSTIDGMTRKVMQLSSGKLCSNPVNPHEQTCCPYPKTCRECSFPVL